MFIHKIAGFWQIAQSLPSVFLQFCSFRSDSLELEIYFRKRESEAIDKEL